MFTLRKGFGVLFRNVSRSASRRTSQTIFDSDGSEKMKNTHFLNHKNYSSSPDQTDDKDTTEMKKVQSGVGKYKFFADYDSPVILDIDEERQLRLENPELFEQDEEKDDEFAGMNVERGVNGVFDVEELVDVLRKENAKNICVLSVPPEYQYVDHMVIVSGKSSKHMKAMAEFIRKLYKRKKSESDYFPIIEGRKSDEWMAIDLGNIALHFQTKDCRLKYDLETLWSIGPEYDDKINQKEDDYITLLKQHSALADLEPLEAETSTQSSTTKKNITNSII